METIIYAINEIREEVEFVLANSPTMADTDLEVIIGVGVTIGWAVLTFIGCVILDKKLRG